MGEEEATAHQDKIRVTNATMASGANGEHVRKKRNSYKSLVHRPKGKK
jgi:hypothetical protein